MLIQNDPFSKYCGVDRWNEYDGEGIVVVTGEAFNAAKLQALGYNAISPIPDYVSDAAHPFQTALTFFQVAPKAKLISLPYADSTPINGTTYSFIKDAIPFIEQYGACLMFTSCEGRPDDSAALDAALAVIPSFFYAMAAGNHSTDDYNYYLDCEHVYGVGAYNLANGSAVPASFTSVTQYVDCAGPTNVYVPTDDGKSCYTVDGTSFSAPWVIGMLAKLQCFMLKKLGRLLTEDEICAFVIDNSKDIGDAGFDDKSGWGAFALPDPATIDLSRYQPTIKEVSTIKASDILNKAIGFLGVKESPANSNNVIFNTDYYGRAVSGDFPWCCAFQWDIFRMCGASDLFYGGQKTAYCPSLEAYAKAHSQWVTSDYKPGDCVLFNWSGGSVAEHIGIVESVNADGSLNTIEGNTADGNDSNGGEVMRRVRTLNYVLGAFRPQYAEESEEEEVPRYNSISEVPDWGKATVQKLITAGALKGGDTGLNLSDDMLRIFVIHDRMGLYK